MRYQKIHCQIWHDEKFKHLSSEAQRLFLYLMSSPHSNSIGLYVIHKMYIAADLNIDIKDIQKLLEKPLEELIDAKRVIYDERASLLMIVNHLKHNKIENEKQAKGAEKVVKTLPKSDIYEEVIKNLDKKYHKPLKDALLDLYCPAEEKSSEEPDAPDTPPEEIDHSAHEIAWLEFWDNYPKRNGKRIGKEKTKELFFKLKPKDLTNIIIAVKNYAESELVKKDIGIKDPQRFISNRDNKEYWKEWMEPETNQDNWGDFKG